MSREAFRELTEEALIDLAAALEEISAEPGYKAILTILERLAADVAIQAIEGQPQDLPRLQGQREALLELRAQLDRIRTAGRELAQARRDEGRGSDADVARTGGDEDEIPQDLLDFTRPGGADFG